MRIPQEIVEQKLGSAPDNIRAAATSDSFAEALAALAKENRLSSEQSAALEEESLYVLLGIEKAEAFQSNIQNRTEVSGEVASKMVTGITNLIRGFIAQKANGTKLPFVYEPLQIEVTPGLFKYRAQSFPIRTISEVSLIKMRLEFGTLVINGLVIIGAGIPLLLTFSTWSILGIVALGICGFNVWHIFQKHYVVSIAFQSAEEITIQTTNMDFAVGLRDALQEAIST